LTCKFKPEKAVRGAKEWAEDTIKEKQELEEKKKAKQEKAQEKRDKEEVEKLQSTLKKMKGMNAKSDDSETKGDGEMKGEEIDRGSSERLSLGARSRSRSPGSSQESDTDSWTITEPQHAEEK
jgi:chaperone BCS1